MGKLQCLLCSQGGFASYSENALAELQGLDRGQPLRQLVRQMRVFWGGGVCCGYVCMFNSCLHGLA